MLIELKKQLVMPVKISFLTNNQEDYAITQTITTEKILPVEECFIDAETKHRWHERVGATKIFTKPFTWDTFYNFNVVALFDVNENGVASGEICLLSNDSNKRKFLPKEIINNDDYYALRSEAFRYFTKINSGKAGL